jgi:hypothetical protein
MRLAVEIVIGAVLALGLCFYVQRLKPKRRPLILGLSLSIAALIYVAFAAFGMALETADASWLVFEIGGLVFYSAFAYLGIRQSLWYVAAGWTLHVLWDTVIHTDASFVPGFYPGVCIGFDVAVACYALYLLLKRSGN